MNNLKHDSKKIDQLKELKIKLKEHQKNSIYAMKEIEDTGEVNVNINSYITNLGYIVLKYNSIPKDELIINNVLNSYHCSSDNNWNMINYKIKTNIGILSDKVGSGKTFMILGLIINNIMPKNNNVILQSSIFTSISYEDNQTAIKTNLILIPHNLATQWYTSIKDYTKLKVKLINRMSALNSIKSVYNVTGDNIDTQKELKIIPEETIEYYDIILLTSSVIGEFMTIYSNIKWARIIIDEVLSIKLPSEVPLKANFTWFITATPSALSYIKKYYIKHIFTSMQSIVFNYLIIKNNDEYITESMNLPTFKQILIRCLTSKAINLIQNYVSDDIINMLNAGNLPDAIKKINCNADTDDNIFQVITSKLKKELHNKNEEYKYMSNIIPVDEEQHKETLKKIKDKIESIEERYNAIEEKIKSYLTDSCPICLNDFTNPAVMKCCGNLFCVPCLTMINGVCPMCRTQFNLKDINIIIKEDDKIKKTKELLSKSENLINIINKKKNGKFLIFSCYENTNDNLSVILKENKINYSKLLGSCGAINNIIDKFNKGEVNVLLLNAEYYGSGINLQMATDIIIYHTMNYELETQIIGRAQRIGRTEQLNVYYLLHENEKHNVVNPTLDLSIYDKDDKEFLKYLSQNKNKGNNISTVEISEMWDSDEEEIYKENEKKRLKLLEKRKIKKITSRKNNNDI
jgi:hypothetical protein